MGGFTILPLEPPLLDQTLRRSSWSDHDQEGDVDIPHADHGIRPTRSSAIITPGESVTDDPQWMR